MGWLLNELRNHPELYSSLRRFYGRTIGLHWLKTSYLRTMGFSTGLGRARLVSAEAANAVIIAKLSSCQPFMVARYGSTEFRSLFGDNLDTLCFSAGFFPNEERLLPKFRATYIEASKWLDYLCVWNYKNHFLKKRRLVRQLPNLDSLFPLGVMSHRAPWVAALEGRRVLVIHPFTGTIERQMKRRRELGILPPLENLETLKAVQTIAGNPDPRFGDWFEALDYMKAESDKMDYDVALIGAGAYGLPLAAHVKSQGKQAIHVGGALQYFFGINARALRGREAEAQVNEHWVFPSEAERVKNYKKIEGGRYW